jgi:hypothetical protein
MNETIRVLLSIMGGIGFALVILSILMKAMNIKCR